jgi:hypothetical protein
MIFLPNWDPTRHLVEWAAFPALLALVYVIGMVPLFLVAGPGIMLDFGSAPGVQAVPILAVLLHWARVPQSAAMRQVHVAGLAWVGACLAIAWQSGSGQTVAMWSVASAAAGVLLLVWLVTAAGVARAWMTASVPQGEMS